MTGLREAQLIEAADLLLDARRTLQPIADLPENLRPVDQAEAYFVQDRLAQAYGEIGGWKVGASSPDAEPTFAPMPRAWIAASGAMLAGHRFRGIECEIAFLLGHDLPQRTTPYTRDEVYAAVASCHPAIEVVESGLTDPLSPEVTPLSKVADLQVHGAFVYGPAMPNWQSIDFTREHVTLAIDGAIRLERTGSNLAGDLLRLLPWLASQTARTGGLRSGQWITTGSWTGCIPADTSAAADATFSTAGRVNLRFER